MVEVEAEAEEEAEEGIRSLRAVRRARFVPGRSTSGRYPVNSMPSAEALAVGRGIEWRR